MVERILKNNELLQFQKIMKGTITWLDISEAMPKVHECVLVATPYSKYPACVGLYNGLKWIDIDQQTEILNVQHFAYINKPDEL